MLQLPHYTPFYARLSNDQCMGPTFWSGWIYCLVRIFGNKFWKKKSRMAEWSALPPRVHGDSGTIPTEVKTFFGGIKMKDMGSISYYLGIEIKQEFERGTIIMSQQKYVEKVLARLEMENCRPSPTPMDGNSKLQNPENVPDSALPYQNLMGSLIYLSVS